MSIPYADIIILALVAGFILLRLRSILGEDSEGNNAGPGAQDNAPAEKTNDNEKVFPLHPGLADALKQELEPADKTLVEGLDQSLQDSITDIKKIEPEFDVLRFIDGAKGAFEMVLKAFHDNDADTLKYLLADDIEEVFVEEAEKNQQSDIKTQTTLVSIPEVEILDIELNRKRASIQLRLVSEQISVERDSDGEIVRGDPSDVQRIEDEWTFERELGSKQLNWLITAT